MTPRPCQTLWCDLKPEHAAFARVRELAGQSQLVMVSEVAEADVAFGQPPVDAVLQSPRLRWVQVTSAGYTRYDRDDVRAALRRRGGMLTNASSVFDEPCAEHLLAMMLALARQLPFYWDAQKQRTWRPGRPPRDTALLAGQTALLVGFGAINRRLAELLAPFRMRLAAVRRQPRGDEGIQTLTPAQAIAFLPEADHVVNALPESDQTRGMVSGEWFRVMKPGAVFYNVGRGSTVDQAALRQHLESGRLAAAYLDVTSPEPLPSDDPLWTAPNCHITPHVGGGHADMWDRLIAHFRDNLARFRAGENLADRVI